MTNSVNPKSAELIRFLTELRTRLIYSLLFLFVIALVFIYFANDLYALLAAPLLRYLPSGHLIATQIMAPFFVPFKLAFFLSFILAVPFFLYQIWAFLSPALYGHEKRFLWVLLFVSTLLFYAGVSFAYFVIFPLLFHFLAGVVPSGVIVSPDMSQYLELTLKLLLVFGGLFEIPIIMVFLVSANIVTRTRLKYLRPYAIVGAFIISLLLAPPDVFSQVVMAVPMMLLYEAGIFLAQFVKVKKSKKVLAI